MKLKVSTLISASCPGWMKPMSRFEHHGLDLEPAVARHHHHQGLRRRHHAADRMDRELLHHAVDRRRQQLKPGLLLGLDQLLGEADRLLLGLGELVGEGAPVFGLRLAARLADRGDRRFRLLQMALLDAELLLLLDQQLQRLQIGDPRAQVLLHQYPAHVDARLDDRDHRLELVRWWPPSWPARLPSAPADGRSRRSWRGARRPGFSRSWRCTAIRVGFASAGGEKSARGSSPPASAVRSRATLSCSARRSLRR